MQEYFRVLNHQIPVELKDFYQAISNEFEAKIYDSKSMEKNYEETEKGDHESNH